MGIYIAQTPREPMEPFIGGLLVGVWPLAVAAVLFMLIDIRLHQNLTAVATETSKEPELAESPMERRSRVTGGKPHREESYFNLNGAPLPKQEPAPVVTIRSALTEENRQAIGALAAQLVNAGGR